SAFALIVAAAIAMGSAVVAITIAIAIMAVAAIEAGAVSAVMAIGIEAIAAVVPLAIVVPVLIVEVARLLERLLRAIAVAGLLLLSVNRDLVAFVLAELVTLVAVGPRQRMRPRLTVIVRVH